MTRYIQGKDGKFEGSIGDGVEPPTAAPMRNPYALVPNPDGGVEADDISALYRRFEKVLATEPPKKDEKNLIDEIDARRLAVPLYRRNNVWDDLGTTLHEARRLQAELDEAKALLADANRVINQAVQQQPDPWAAQHSTPYIKGSPSEATLNHINAISDRLGPVWSPDTAAGDGEGWSHENPTLGHCAIASLLIQDEFGGDLMRVENEGVSHYYNVLPDGTEVDLTREQFSVWNPSPASPRSRDYVLSNESTASRYSVLNARYRDGKSHG